MKSNFYKLLVATCILLSPRGADAQLITTVAGNGIAGNSSWGSMATLQQLSQPTGISYDFSTGTAGVVYIADSTNNVVRYVDVATGIIYTYAGGSTTGIGDGKPASVCGFTNPVGVAADGYGNLYIADDNADNRVRIVNTSGIINTFVNPSPAAPGNTDNVYRLTNATLNQPYGLKAFGLGGLYIADRANSLVRKVDPTTGYINTIAGHFVGYTQDGGPATVAELHNPAGMTISSAGDLYIADQANNVVRRINHTGTHVISTVAGNGFAGNVDGIATSAMLYRPSGVAFDNLGNMYIADAGNNSIRKVTAAGAITTTVLGLNNPTGICFGGIAGTTAYNLYVADKGDNVIYKILPSGVTSIIAGIVGSTTTPGDNNLATLANFNAPSGLVCDAAGENIFIVDSGASVVRKISYNSGPIASLTILGGGSGYTPGGEPCTITGPLGTVAASGNLTVTAGTVTGITISSMPNAGNWFNATMTVTVTGLTSGSSNCTANVTAFTPGCIGTIAGNGVLGDGGGLGISTASNLSHPMNIGIDNAIPQNLYISNTDSNDVRELVGATNFTRMIKFAGLGHNSLYGGEGVYDTLAGLGGPNGIVFDASSGNCFIAAGKDNRIRRADPTLLRMYTYAGNGFGRYGAAATYIDLNNPTAVAQDPSGNIYIADRENNAIRLLDTKGAMSTFAGTGLAAGYTGDGGQASNATLKLPTGVSYYSGSGTDYLFIADAGNNVVRQVNMTTGVITTAAGSAAGTPGYGGDGAPANSPTVLLNSPNAVEVDPLHGDLYIADKGNNCVRKIAVSSTGLITLVAGVPPTAGAIGDGGPAITSELNQPYSVCADTFGSFYVADRANDIIRKVDNAGIISTYAGAWANFLGPSSVTMDAAGNMYVCDQSNNVIKKVAPTGVILTASVATGGTKYLIGDPFTINTGLPLASCIVTAVGPGSINTSSLAFGGTGYVINNTFNISGGTTTATGKVTSVGPGSIVSATVAVGLGGTGWSTSNTFTVTGGGGTGCTCQVTGTLAGAVTSFIILTGGSGYIAGGPYLTTGPGSGLSVSVPLTGIAGPITGYTILTTGAGYTVTPVSAPASTTATLGTGSGATINILSIAGPVTSFSITSGGSGYGLSGLSYGTTGGSGTLLKVDVTRIQRTVTIVAGSGGIGFAPGTPATSGTFYYPIAVAVDPLGNNLYVADPNNNAIRKVTLTGPGSPAMTTFVNTSGVGAYTGIPGTASVAQINNPSALAVDATGTKLYIADETNNAVEMVTPLTGTPMISLIAGSPTLGGGYSGDGGAATAAKLNTPTGIAVDKSGNVYISDFGNERIRKVSLSGTITTVVDTGLGYGYSGDGADGRGAQIFNPQQMGVDTSGSLYFADENNSVIRKVTTVLLASFTDPVTLTCQDSCVLFKNTSIGVTDSIRWMVSPAGPVISNSAIDTPTICFPTNGVFTVALHIYYKGRDSSFQVSVTSSATPVPSITRVTGTTAGHTLSVTPTGYSSFQWYTGTGTGSPILGAVVNTYVFTTPGTYTLQVDSNGCPGTSSITVQDPTDVKPVVHNNNKYWLSQQGEDVNTVNLFSQYPADDNIAVNMFDATGREVLSNKWNKGTSTIQIKAPSLAPGMYMIRLTNTNTSEVLKWLKD